MIGLWIPHQIHNGTCPIPPRRRPNKWRSAAALCRVRRETQSPGRHSSKGTWRTIYLFILMSVNQQT